ncbi:MAG: hypothetical protein FVQ85_14505 [Planctomycetes bacterium]|nr:hypothetical protein [Planctomycetota bacterium]
MNSLLESGVNIADIAKKYKDYDYWEIYHAVNDFSLIGKKRMITNRLNKLKKRETKEEKEKLIGEIKQQLDEIYDLSKKNGKKLIDINKVLSR